MQKWTEQMAFQGVHMTIVISYPILQHIAMTLYRHAFDTGGLNCTVVCTVISCREYGCWAWGSLRGTLLIGTLSDYRQFL